MYWIPIFLLIFGMENINPEGRKGQYLVDY